MLAGSVAYFESVRIARRRRFFFLRIGFGLLVLVVVGLNDWMLERLLTAGPGGASRDLSPTQLTQVARSLFLWLTAMQMSLVLGLTPGLVADAIASERHRKTLDVLLTSRLSGGEIVFGKVVPRLLYLSVFLALVLPIVSSLTLLGGVDPEALVWNAAILGASAFFLASLGILASVEVRVARNAIAAAYGLMAAWLLLPTLMKGIFTAIGPPLNAGDPSRFWSTVVGVAEGFHQWFWPPNPIALLSESNHTGWGNPSGFRQTILFGVGRLVIYGALLTATAAARLRSSARRLEGKGGVRRSAMAREGRFHRRKTCGDRPIYWKEAYFTRKAGGIGQGLARLVGRLLLAGIVVAVILGSGESFQELMNYGYGFGDWNSYSARMNYNFSVRYVGAILFGFWMLRLGSTIASGIASEREQDTWISLLATPLDGDEIVLGKMLGPLRSSAGFGVGIVVIWLTGLASGAVHPSGFFLAVVCLVIFTWYVVALGMYLSLRFRSTWRAQATVLGILITHVICCVIPSPPFLLGASLLSYADVDSFFNRGGLGLVFESRGPGIFILAYTLGGPIFYGIAAGVMTWRAFRNFDVVADRPRHPVLGPPLDLGSLDIESKTKSSRPDSDGLFE